MAYWLEKTKYFIKNNWEEFKEATDREKREEMSDGCCGAKKNPRTFFY